MAKTVYTIEEVTLQDNTEVTLKPINIKAQKKFMQIMEEFKKIKDEDDGFEILLRAGALCLAKQRPEFWDGSGDGAYTDAFEEAMDQQTLIRVLDVCGGTNFGDPKLREMAEAAVLGTTST